MGNERFGQSEAGEVGGRRGIMHSKNNRAIRGRKRKQKDLPQSPPRSRRVHRDVETRSFVREAAKDVTYANSEADRAKDDHEDGLGVQPPVKEKTKRARNSDGGDNDKRQFDGHGELL